MFEITPKAVFFDFGGTLCENGKSDFVGGFSALLAASKNPEVTSAEELFEIWNKMHERLKTAKGTCSDCPYGIETPLEPMLNYIFEFSGLKYDISLSECGIIFDRANFPIRMPTQNMARLQDALNSKGVRTAIISNTTMNAAEMRAAADEKLPNNRFEFVLTSADLLFTKPAPFMFEIALKKTGLKPNECIYCGDSFGCDVVGAANAGISTVLYDKNAEKAQMRDYYNGIEYMVVNSWLELCSYF